MNSPVPALAGQDLAARDLICVKPRRYNLALHMLRCNIASGQAMCAREAWLVHAARFQREFLNHVTMTAKLCGAADCVEVGAMILDGPRRVLVSSTLVIKTDRGQQNSDRDLLANGVGALTCGCGRAQAAFLWRARSPPNRRSRSHRVGRCPSPSPLVWCVPGAPPPLP